jgi:hypothetical protein
MPEFWETDPISNAAQSQAVAVDWWANDPVAKPAAPEKPESWGEYGKGLLQKVGQGATFNFGDEIAAGAGAVGNKVMRAVGVDVPEKSYSDILSEVREPEKEFEKRHPYQAIGAEVAGGLSTLAAGPAKAIVSAPNFLARVGKSAKIGAAYGAGSGFGRGEGAIDRAASGTEGGLTGAVLGPVATEVAAPIVGAVVRGARAGGRTLGNAARFVAGNRANPDARLNQALEKQNMTPQAAQTALDEAQAAARLGKTQLDPQFTIADTGPVTRDLADTASLVSGEARGVSGSFLNERARGQYKRVNDYLRRSMQVTRGDFAKTQAKVVEEQKLLSDPAYDAFRKLDVRIPVGDVLYNAQIEDLAAAPALKRVLTEAREQFVAARGKRELSAGDIADHGKLVKTITGDLREAQDELKTLRRARQDSRDADERADLLGRIRGAEDNMSALDRDLTDVRAGKPSKLYSSQAYTELTPARFDAGKRALDDMIDVAKRDGRNNEMRLLTTLKNQLVEVADNATMQQVSSKNGPMFNDDGSPIMESLYAKARDVFGSRADMLDALESGRSFMRGDSELTGAQYKALSTAEKRMFRIGVGREVRKELGRKGLSSDMIGYFDRPNTRDVLEEIMTPGQAKKFYNLIDLEQALAATNTAVRGNSKTALRQQNVLDFSLGVRLGRAIKDQGLRSALSNEIFDQVTKVFAMREGDALAVTKMLFETDPAAQREILARLAQNYGPKPARAIVARVQRIAQQSVLARKRSLSAAIGTQGSEVNLFGLAPQDHKKQP